MAILLVIGPPLFADTLVVAPGGRGTAPSAASVGSIQQAVDRAHAGDVVLVQPGIYAERLSTVRGGRPDAPIVIRAAPSGAVVVTAPGRVLTVRHPHVVVEGLIFDGAYGADDIVRATSAAAGLTLRGIEVRRGSRDGIDLAGPPDVTIADAAIHHLLDATGGRRDAHGIVAGPVRRLRITGSEIHTFSGDAIQIDPGRSRAGWGDVLIEDCELWLAPLAAAENGFAAGVVPGENAIDTKAAPDGRRATLTVRRTRAHGFRGGLIANMAAFNLKEHVDVVVDGVTVWDSEIGFRLRGPASGGSGARVRIQNAVIHDTAVAFRYEDAIADLRIWNCTVGAGVGRAFVPVASGAPRPDVRNVLFLAAGKPDEAGGASNLAVPGSAFVDAPGGDYRLAPDSPAIDAAVSVPEVTADRLGTPRPQGRAPDVGAFEAPQEPPRLDPGRSARETKGSSGRP